MKLFYFNRRCLVCRLCIFSVVIAFLTGFSINKSLPLTDNDCKRVLGTEKCPAILFCKPVKYIKTYENGAVDQLGPEYDQYVFNLKDQSFSFGQNDSVSGVLYHNLTNSPHYILGAINYIAIDSDSGHTFYGSISEKHDLIKGKFVGVGRIVATYVESRFPDSVRVDYLECGTLY